MYSCIQIDEKMPCSRAENHGSLVVRKGERIKEMERGW